MPDPVVRALVRADLPALHPVLERTGLFPPAMLAGMAEPFLAGGSPERWLVALGADRVPLGFAYCVPEQMTAGTFNLLAIAVDPDHHGRGIGTALVAALEAALRGDGARLLLVETSGLDEYAGTRAFYDRLGFIREARIRHFYRDGDDKLVFAKRLA